MSRLLAGVDMVVAPWQLLLTLQPTAYRLKSLMSRLLAGVDMVVAPWSPRPRGSLSGINAGL